MLQLSAKWGGYSGAVMIAILLLSYFTSPKPGPDNYAVSEVFGYVAIFASLALIYFAMNEQSVQAGSEPVVLWKYISVGVGVSVVAGLFFGLYNLFYTSYLDPEFMDTYYAYYISQLPEQSGPVYEAEVARLEAEKAMFMAPTTQVVAMAATVIAAGIPVSVILAFVHKFKAKSA